MKDNNTTTAALADWPGAFNIYKLSRDRVRKNLRALILLAIAPMAIGVALDLVLRTLLGDSAGQAVSQILSSLVGVYFAVVVTRAYLLTARQKHVDFDTSLSIPMSLFWRMFLLNLLTIISVVGGLILLVVPGIIVAMRLYMAPYYLVDQNLSVLDAYKASWHATKGQLGKLWGLIGVGILMFLPSLTIIGILATVYLLFMYGAAGALFYLYLTRERKKDA